MINVNQDAESNLPNKNSGVEVKDEIHKFVQRQKYNKLLLELLFGEKRS